MSEPRPDRRRKIHPLRDALIAGLLTFLISAIGLFIVYREARQAQLAAVRSELLQLATTTAAQVDGDLHATLVSPDQDRSPEYRRAIEPLLRMHRAARDVWYVYTGIMREGRIHWVLDTDRYYKVPGNDDEMAPMFYEYPGEDPELRRAFVEQVALANVEPVVEPEHTYLSAYAPIRDSQGRMVAVLGVDMVLDALEQRLARTRHALELALVAVLLLSILAGAVALKLRRFAAAIVRKLREARAQAELHAADAEQLAAQAESHAAAAEAASRAKASFLAMMSHEIRTPMNGILGVADLLRGMAPTPEQKKLLDILASSGGSLLRIINDVLDFSKMDADRLELQPRPFELRAMVDELRHLLGVPARAKNLDFAIDCDPGLPRVIEGDQQRLTQVLLNLGTNAVKFTDRGEVRLGIERLADTAQRARLQFTFRDTGIGMDAEALARLFTPFTQVADARHQRGGTGLGLVIAQKLVELMGGRIEVSSQPGQGSTFRFTIELPVAQASAESGAVAAGGVEPLDVLVAEDNEVNQTIVSAMLRQLGHRVTVAGNGLEALQVLARQRFDAVLMDCNMPELDGFEATLRLRSRAAATTDSRVPVIALTANASEGDRERCLAAGMDDFLTKRLTLVALQAALERVRTQRTDAAA